MDPQTQPIAPSARRMAPPPEVLPSHAPKKFLYFSGLVFMVTLLLYSGLSFGYVSFLESSISKMEGEIETLSLQVSSEQQKELAQLYSQIKNLQTVLGEHVETTGLFAFFERNTDPKVVYQDVTVSIPDNQVSVEGAAESYDALVSQLAIYEKAPEVTRMLLESSNFESGVVRFKIVLNMTPEIFTPRI